jgi:hypothetical protein
MTRLLNLAAGRGLPSSRYARLERAHTGDLQKRRYTNHCTLGSTPGTLSAHHKVDTGEDGFHLSPWDFADSLGQLPFVDGHKLRHIRDGIAV